MLFIERENNIKVVFFTGM